LADDPQRRNVAANSQWGGRFAAGPSPIMQEINASIGFDRKLWRPDIDLSPRQLSSDDIDFDPG